MLRTVDKIIRFQDEFSDLGVSGERHMPNVYKYIITQAHIDTTRDVLAHAVFRYTVYNEH
ncbi:MAG: hypothetical protein ABI045_00790 [Flavobacteriales bacterium]